MKRDIGDKDRIRELEAAGNAMAEALEFAAYYANDEGAAGVMKLMAEWRKLVPKDERKAELGFAPNQN